MSGDIKAQYCRVVKCFWFFSLIFTANFSLNAVATEDEPLWEYGLGLGYVHFEQYPSSNQFTDLALPFPTFQYRGKILRADDREGARAFLYKDLIFSFEITGGFYPALDSSVNDARNGMPDLPWMFQIGPQAVTKLYENLEFKLSVLHSVGTDFAFTKQAGQVLNANLIYRWDGHVNEQKTSGHLALNVRAGTKEFLATYFEVKEKYMTTDRRTYEVKAGLLNHELTYFQSFHRGFTNFYLGIAVADYRSSANRQSPLHKSDQNISYLMGLTYTLGASKKLSQIHYSSFE